MECYNFLLLKRTIKTDLFHATFNGKRQMVECYNFQLLNKTILAGLFHGNLPLEEKNLDLAESLSNSILRYILVLELD